jgi:hypothetical protein
MQKEESSVVVVETLVTSFIPLDMQLPAKEQGEINQEFTNPFSALD